MKQQKLDDGYSEVPTPGDFDEAPLEELHFRQRGDTLRDDELETETSEDV